MNNIFDSQQEQNYWTQRYQEQRTGWNIGEISTPLKAYFDQLEDKTLRVLIPGAGNAYEAEYLFQQGFLRTHVLDIAAPPLAALRQRVPDFPAEQLILGNFFEHEGQYDLIVEQTFFCSFPPTPANRRAYAQKMQALLRPGGKLVGLWFSMPLTGDMVNRPFGGSKEEYLGYFADLFEVKVLEPCYNSIAPRAGNELFGIMVRKGIAKEEGGE
ncbi:MAG: methyltransferase domain-containing protein [Bacteroidota bacterium]